MLNNPTLLRWRRKLIPDDRLGWGPIFSLGYVSFLFLPAMFGDVDGSGGRSFPLGSISATLVSLALFLPTYFLFFRVRGWRALACMVLMAALALVLMPDNVFSNTYLIYAVAFAGCLETNLWARIAWALGMLASFLAGIVFLRYPMFIFGLTALISIPVFIGNYFQYESMRKGEALKLSHAEVSRLAALSERERIGRDLHDLLGHTLSLIALKSELAGKLVGRDALAARREIDEVTRVARDALSQVRRAVTGIRAAGLETELAAARSLLETCGVHLQIDRDDVPLETSQETVLALCVREAVTNIQRHSRARHAAVRLSRNGPWACLEIGDDGRGGAILVGNGLRGMRERVEAQGGHLEIDSAPAHGTRVHIELPLAADSVGVAPQAPSAASLAS